MAKSKKPTRRNSKKSKPRRTSKKQSSKKAGESGLLAAGRAIKGVLAWFAARLTPQRRRLLASLLLIAAGLLTAGSLLFPSGKFLVEWAAFWSKAFGWGVWLLPLWLLAWGIGLLSLPIADRLNLSLERGAGLALIYAAVLAFLHLPFIGKGMQGARDAAAHAKGGGYVGAFLAVGMKEAFGAVGAALVVIVGLVLSTAFLLEKPVLSLFGWVPKLWERVRRVAASVFSRRRAHLPQASAPVAAATATESAASPTAAPLPEPPAEAPEWVLPRVEDILTNTTEEQAEDSLLEERARLIEETLKFFGAPATVVEIRRGPTVTMFGVEPGYIESRGGAVRRVRVSKIASLADDLALALAAKRVRIQAPVPGKGYVGIEVPNDNPALVTLRQVIESDAFRRLKSPLRIALGKDVAGHPVAVDLAAMPHLLIAGATGSGKSVCVNGIITTFLLHNTPETLRLLLVDPKRVELSGYNGVPHLLSPVIVDVERVVGALQWLAHEMERRYKLLARHGARNIAAYNAKAEAEGHEKLPYLVLVVDELADLMMLAPETTERVITRLAQLARATGIHLILATQRPSVDVVTGVIKANFPARIAFAVASGTDSRVIIDQPGAERLLGRGDMLFMAPDAPEPMRLQGAFVSDEEIRRVVEYWRNFRRADVPGIGGIVDAPPPGIPLKQKPLWEEMEGEENKPSDPLWDKAVEVVRAEGKASASLLQRRLRIGYTRAARLVDEMEERGIVGPPKDGTGVRPVLAQKQSEVAEGASPAPADEKQSP